MLAPLFLSLNLPTLLLQRNRKSPTTSVGLGFELRASHLLGRHRKSLHNWCLEHSLLSHIYILQLSSSRTNLDWMLLESCGLSEASLQHQQPLPSMSSSDSHLTVHWAAFDISEYCVCSTISTSSIPLTAICADPTSHTLTVIFPATLLPACLFIEHVHCLHFSL
jgi:hypothetical protein